MQAKWRLFSLTTKDLMPPWFSHMHFIEHTVLDFSLQEETLKPKSYLQSVKPEPAKWEKSMKHPVRILFQKDSNQRRTPESHSERCQWQRE